MATPLEWLNEFRLSISDIGTNSGNDQFSPEITQLTNGNVVIIWASNVEPTSGPGSTFSTDILGQVFDPFGQQ